MRPSASPCPLRIFRRFSQPLFLFLILFILSSFCVHAETYKVLRVYDGDTITILKAGQKQSIRLVGIDAPGKVNAK